MSIDIDPSILDKILKHINESEKWFTYRDIKKEILPNFHVDLILHYLNTMRDTGIVDIRDVSVMGDDPEHFKFKANGITPEFLKQGGFSNRKPSISGKKPTTENQFNYVSPTRIDELQQISNKEFDLSKLIRLCEEINDCWANGNYYAVGMLLRAILDHIPPIFGFNNYRDVASQVGDSSTKRTLQHLQNSARNISDSFLHVQIRKRELAPTSTQVNFSQDLDRLLEEVIRVIS